MIRNTFTIRSFLPIVQNILDVLTLPSFPSLLLFRGGWSATMSMMASSWQYKLRVVSNKQTLRCGVV